MDDDLKTLIKWVVIALFTIILISAPLQIGSAYFEAKAYNNITGKNVSTWDAMFVELRVQEPAKNDKP